MGWIGGLLNVVGNAVGGFFGFKRNQAEALQTGIRVLSDVSASNSQREQAIAQIIASEATSGYWLAAVWRPLLMVIFGGLIVSFWFGYTPPYINDPMSPMMHELFTLLKIGIGGYIPARTVEKIVGQLGLSQVLRKFIEKKLL